MPRLIINADDLGMNPPRSHGIFLCFEQGIVTSATLVCNGSDSDAAARHARERGLLTGIHLNLTDGTPLSAGRDVPTLISVEGNFMGRDGLAMVLDEGRVDPQHIEREVRAQIEWFLDHRGAPTHLDSHHHIHIRPAIVPLLLPVLERYGIRLVRIPREDIPPFGYEVSPERLQAISVHNEHAAAARPLFESEGISSTQHFRGHCLTGLASAKNLRHTLSRLPEGTTELMVHPGSPTPIGSDFDRDPQRQTELRMLCDQSVRPLLTERKIELCSYGDL
ncbi:MAG: hypothetical protein Greene041619_966 [Candidatus Peregrinibacteria bacterium Greene0416_19]|nr:MAG: hypothetical protein Greene041619_966 [Candidatus Peregrinibacteria bacterium Greene0416_19]